MNIPPEALEAGAKAACDAEFWPGMWETLDPESNEAKVYRKVARAAFLAMIEAWPGMYTHEWQRPWLGGMSGTDLILPLTEKQDDKA